MTLVEIPTQSQSQAPQVATPAPADASTDSGGTLVPAEFRFTETQYEPTEDVTSKQLSNLSQDDLLTGLAKQYRKTSGSFAFFSRDLGLLVSFYDAVVARYSNERVSKNRNEEPTLREAFAAIGWNYDAARKMKQRYNNSMKALPDYASAPKPLQLKEGDKVKSKTKAGDGGVKEGVIVGVDTTAEKADVLFDGTTEPTTVLAESLAKVRVPVHKVKIGDRILCEDTGEEHEYEGHGKFPRTKTPTLAEQKKERSLAKINAKQEREKAKAEEKNRKSELRKAEAARRDLDKLALIEIHQTDAAAKKATRTVKEPVVKSTKAKQFLVARIGDTQEFGVFPDSCTEHNAASTLTIGTKQVCEAERDRLNTKRAPDAESLGILIGASNTQVQQTAVLVQ